MDRHEIRAKTFRFNFCATQCYSATLECMPMLLEIVVAVSFLQLDLSLALSCSLNQNASAPLLLASHQESLALSTRLLLHQLLFLLASHQEPLGISPRFLQLLFQEWVRPLALINLMREGEEFFNLTAEIRLDGWMRFGVSSLTLTLIIKLSFNLHLTN
jgi:hypothetical protein